MMHFTAALILAIVAVLAATFARAADATLHHERFRPQFHFTPDRGWMNDPNGLVFFDGEYHLFFQHRPDALTQTPVMSWGHAVSTDLIHWKQLPIALSPDEKDGWIWSGSAVVDWNNTSGFGVADKPPLIAMYTAAKEPFAQSLAYSNDRGRTWEKFAGNPVLPHIAGAHDNRDPHVIWHEPTKRWIVVLYKDVDDTFCFFASSDARHWTHLQDLRVPGCTECPDFFPLALDGDAMKVKWIFTAANGKYLVGAFDGSHFKPEQEVRQVDFGRNFYAVQTWSDVKGRRRIQIAWMRDGKYPGMPFNQQMSFPVELTLRSTADGPRLFREPVHEIERLHTEERHWNDVVIKEGREGEGGSDPLPGVDTIKGDLFDITADVDPGDATEFALIVRGEAIVYNAKATTLSALGATAPLVLTARTADAGRRLLLRILVDRTSIETFADAGRVSLTSCFLPKDERAAPPPPPPPLALSVKGGSVTVRALVVHELRSAWP